MTGIFENTITIGTSEYKELVKDGIMLEVVKNYLINEKYVSRNDLKQLLGMPLKEGEEE